jgi:hypothetical protein
MGNSLILIKVTCTVNKCLNAYLITLIRPTVQVYTGTVYYTKTGICYRSLNIIRYAKIFYREHTFLDKCH